MLYCIWVGYLKHFVLTFHVLDQTRLLRVVPCVFNTKKEFFMYTVLVFRVKLLSVCVQCKLSMYQYTAIRAAAELYRFCVLA